MSSLIELKQQRNKILTDMSALASKPWTTESRTAFDKMSKDAGELDGDIQRAEQIASIEARQNDFPRSPRPGIGESFTSGSPEQRKKDFSAAFRSYALQGLGALNSEQRALLTTSDATGGALIPQEFAGVLIEAQKFYGSISTKVAQKVTNSNGAPMKISYVNDTANGLTLLPTEGTSSPAETDPLTFSTVVGTDTVSGGLVRISFQELEDSAFDFDTLIRNFFGRRYARGLATAVTTGKDSAGTALPSFPSGGLLGAATVGTTTATLAAGIGWTDIVAAYGALDAAYAATASWVLNTSTRATLLAMKDGFGR